MSTILDSFPEAAQSGRPPKYPWDEWLDGRVWRLTQGTDFDCTLRSFRVRFYHAAKARQLKVRTTFDGDDSIVVQAHSVNGVKAAPGR